MLIKIYKYAKAQNFKVTHDKSLILETYSSVKFAQSKITAFNNYSLNSSP
jgi:hypothetical protein